MNTEALMSSPFAQMLAPEDVFRALRESTALDRLPGRICRPLDKFETAATANAFCGTAEIIVPADVARLDD